MLCNKTVIPLGFKLTSEVSKNGCETKDYLSIWTVMIVVGSLLSRDISLCCGTHPCNQQPSNNNNATVTTSTICIPQPPEHVHNKLGTRFGLAAWFPPCHVGRHVCHVLTRKIGKCRAVEGINERQRPRTPDGAPLYIYTRHNTPRHSICHHTTPNNPPNT